VKPGPQNGPHPRHAAGWTWIGVKFLAAELTSEAPRHDSACAAPANRIAAAQTMVILTIFDTVYLHVVAD
jgi:hypothetical protein